MTYPALGDIGWMPDSGVVEHARAAMRCVSCRESWPCYPVQVSLAAADFEAAIVRHVEMDRWAQADSWLWVHDPELSSDVLRFYADDKILNS